jgi:plasmid stabilization system protein ParE
VTQRAVFHRLAEREFAEAAEYFERERPGLCAAFISEVERCLSAIVEFPESGRILAGPVRRRIVRRFPYGVLYSIQPDHIRVLAVMHSRRRPMYWAGRE